MRTIKELLSGKRLSDLKKLSKKTLKEIGESLPEGVTTHKDIYIKTQKNTAKPFEFWNVYFYDKNDNVIFELSEDDWMQRRFNDKGQVVELKYTELDSPGINTTYREYNSLGKISKTWNENDPEVVYEYWDDRGNNIAGKAVNNKDKKENRYWIGDTVVGKKLYDIATGTKLFKETVVK